MLFVNTCKSHELITGQFGQGVFASWFTDKEIVLSLLRRSDICNPGRFYNKLDQTMQNDHDVAKAMFAGCTYDTIGPSLWNNTISPSWNNEQFVRSLIRENLNNDNKNCDWMSLLKLPLVKNNRDLVYELIPMCTFRNYEPDEQLLATLTADKEMVLRLLRYNPFLLSYTDEKHGWSLPPSYETDTDVLGLMRSAKRLRLEKIHDTNIEDLPNHMNVGQLLSLSNALTTTTGLFVQDHLSALHW